VRAEEEAEAEARASCEQAAKAAELEEKPDAEICRELGLPDPETLSPGDDFAAFMARAVPERIRRRALRRLWTSNPALANLDGLLEYGEDYTDSATMVESLQTAYQVGRGMIARAEEAARGISPVEDAEDATETTAPEDFAEEDAERMSGDADADTVTGRAGAGAVEPAEGGQAGAADARSDDPLVENAAPPPPLRMRFTFASDTRGDR